MTHSSSSQTVIHSFVELDSVLDQRSRICAELVSKFEIKYPGVRERFVRSKLPPALLEVAMLVLLNYGTAFEIQRILDIDRYALAGRRRRLRKFLKCRRGVTIHCALLEQLSMWQSTNDVHTMS